MPRHISFALTTDQVMRRSKTVTRRCGWKHLKTGDILIGVEKAQGLKKGEKVKKIATIRVESVRDEPLNLIVQNRTYGDGELIREGFPTMSPQEFVDFFCNANKIKPWQAVRRIEFSYVDSTTTKGSSHG